MIIKRQIIMAFVFCGIIAGLVGFKFHGFQAKTLDLSQFHGTLLTQPREIKPFNLMGIDGRTFNNASLQGHWTLLFFGFTSCHSVCPLTMAELGQMYRLLHNQHVQSLPQVVMISLDSERDTAERLAQYVHTFNAEFYGARGNEHDVAQLAHELGVAYATIQTQNKNTQQSYDIEHTGTIIMVNPQGKVTAFFTTPHQAQALADDYLLLNA